MPKKQSLRKKKIETIKELTFLGFSSRDINKSLRDAYGSGIRRKILLQEMSSAKGLGETSKEKRTKSIPKKYRTPKPVIKDNVGYIYRGSLIVSSVPLHSRPFNRHYLGFRLNVFSYSKSEVLKALNSMKKEFIRMIGNELGSLPYAKEQTLGRGIDRIAVRNPDSLNGKWFFAIEEQGRDIGSREGRI